MTGLVVPDRINSLAEYRAITKTLKTQLAELKACKAALKQELHHYGRLDDLLRAAYQAAPGATMRCVQCARDVFEFRCNLHYRHTMTGKKYCYKCYSTLRRACMLPPKEEFSFMIRNANRAWNARPAQW